MKPITPICPKCAYDQSGEITTWKTKCPLTGTCPECGQQFQWANILDPSRVQLTWYAEHAPTNRALIKRTPPTLWMLLIPNRYWKRVTLETTINLRRLTLWLIALPIVLHIFTSIAHFVALFELRHQNNIAWIKYKITATPADQLIVDNYIESLSDPQWLGSIALSGLRHPYMNFGQIGTEFAGNGFYVAAFVAGSAIMWTFMLGILPATRKIAKLRFVHVIRAMLITTLIPLIYFELGRLLDAADTFELVFLGYKSKYIESFGVPIVAIASGIFLIIWTHWFWIAAIKTGWKIRPFWPFVTLVFIASLLGSIICAGLIVAATGLLGMGIEAILF